MKIAKKKPVKDKVKAKIAKVKDKVKSIKGKVKGACALMGVLLLVAGCSFDTTPASRATTATVTVEVRNYGGTNSVSNSVHDVAQASADSEGSTETQTATPTLDIRTKIDARYNDAISGATAASRSTLGLIGDGITGVLDMMASKKSGTVAVTKTDGTPATVKCENGQCSICEDCTP